MIGKTLDGRYEILERLGKGGMGEVYEARHTGTGRRVAVKVILSKEVTEADVARFHREARSAGAIESMHIAQVFDTGTDPDTGVPYIAMEYLDGEELGSLIKRLGCMPVDLVLRIGVQACMGLSRAHAAGVIHRDIKPANLYLTHQEGSAFVVKLLDFGIAKVAEAPVDEESLTRSGMLIGSPLYMSPEQARNVKTIDARSDLFSLGIVLYQCLTGLRPNDELSALGELIIAICTEPVPPIQDAAPWVPVGVADAVQRALAIKKEERYASAAEFQAALETFLPEGHAIDESMLVPIGADTRERVAPRASPLEHSSTASATSFRVSQPSGESAPSKRRGLIAGVVVAAAVGGALAYRAVTGPGDSPAAPPVPAGESAEAVVDQASSGRGSMPSAAPNVEIAPTTTAPEQDAGTADTALSSTPSARPTPPPRRPPTVPPTSRPAPPPKPIDDDDEDSRK